MIDQKSEWKNAYRMAKSWPFIEANRLVERLAANPSQRQILFETGYGPSGLPHIGTFGEVVRTAMVRNAFRNLSTVSTRLVVFSDDMDGLRKIPENVPNTDMLGAHLGRSVSDIPDPFGTHASFGEHNNARLRDFLDGFGFEYEFMSSTEQYRAGRFDNVLQRILAQYEEIVAIVAPELGAERQKTYSPFLPVCPRTRRVMQEPLVARDAKAGLIAWRDPDTGKIVEQSIYGGSCKLQWRVDWAMRWVALGVDYEMAGKDLIDSVRISGRIARLLGSQVPQSLIYELFLDEQGEKISKSRGNGLTIEEWLRYGPAESLALFMHNKPRAAKRLHFDVIPRMVDEYISHLARYQSQGDDATVERIDNPVWHIHAGTPPTESSMPGGKDGGLGYSLLMNLAAACNARNEETLWGFVQRYRKDASPERHPFLGRLITHALRYAQDFVLPHCKRRNPSPKEAEALEKLRISLRKPGPSMSGAEIQTRAYEIGKESGFTDLRDWFRALYQILLGQDSGPRFGSFVELHGIEETAKLIDQALE